MFDMRMVSCFLKMFVFKSLPSNIFILVTALTYISTIFMDTLFFLLFFGNTCFPKMIVLAVSTIKYISILVTALTYISLVSLEYSVCFFYCFFLETTQFTQRDWLHAEPGAFGKNNKTFEHITTVLTSNESTLFFINLLS